MKRVFGMIVTTSIVLSASSVLAATRSFAATMDVSHVVPLPAQAGTSTATGSCMATLDDQTGQVSFSGTFAGLNASATSVSLRGPAVSGTGPAPVVVPTTTFTASTSGSFAGNGTLTPDLVSAMITGETYCEVRDTPNFPDGEIRGQLVVNQPVPALPRWALALLGMLLVGTATSLLRKRGLGLPA